MTRAKPLSCGGKGPCCHVAYAHRHCEHCDTVIDLRSYLYPPGQPYRPWWQPSGGTYSNVGDFLTTQFNTGASSTQNALPEHACEVTP